MWWCQWCGEGAEAEAGPGTEHDGELHGGDIPKLPLLPHVIPRPSPAFFGASIHGTDYFAVPVEDGFHILTVTEGLVDVIGLMNHE